MSPVEIKKRGVFSYYNFSKIFCCCLCIYVAGFVSTSRYVKSTIVLGAEMRRQSDWSVLTEEHSISLRIPEWCQSTGYLLRFTIYKKSPYHQQWNPLRVRNDPLHPHVLHSQTNPKEVGRINL